MVADQVQTGLREKGKGSSCILRALVFILIPGFAENFSQPLPLLATSHIPCPAVSHLYAYPFSSCGGEWGGEGGGWRFNHLVEFKSLSLSLPSAGELSFPAAFYLF